MGVLTYELLVGFPPFVAENTTVAAAAALSHVFAGQGAGAPFVAAHATAKTLSFPASVSPAARNFISQALADRPEDRPTVVELLQHPWLRRAAQVTPF